LTCPARLWQLPAATGRGLTLVGHFFFFKKYFILFEKEEKKSIKAHDYIQKKTGKNRMK
jgi:hypothetical protein